MSSGFGYNLKKCMKTQKSVHDAYALLLNDSLPPHPFPNFGVLVAVLPIQVAARYKAWICGRSIAGTAGSNLAGSMGVCFSAVR